MFKTILLPVDGRPFTKKTVDTAIHFAKLHGSKIVILSAAEPRLFQASDKEAVETGEKVEAKNRQTAAQHVDEVAEAARQHGIAYETAIAQSHSPSDVILNAAEQFQCDIIFMATRGKMGVMDTMFSESQTQNVLQNARVPVLVFP